MDSLREQIEKLPRYRVSRKLGKLVEANDPKDICPWVHIDDVLALLPVEGETDDVGDCDPVVRCPSCGCVNDASVSNREDVIEHLTKGKIPVVVPVWTCHACDESWTGHRSEAIRDAAVLAASRPAETRSAEEDTIITGDGLQRMVCAGELAQERPAETRWQPGYTELLEACKEFVRKCECGQASSRRSYAQMKAAIELAEASPTEKGADA